MASSLNERRVFQTKPTISFAAHIIAGQAFLQSKNKMAAVIATAQTTRSNFRRRLGFFVLLFIVRCARKWQGFGARVDVYHQPLARRCRQWYCWRGIPWVARPACVLTGLKTVTRNAGRFFVRCQRTKLSGKTQFYSDYCLHYVSCLVLLLSIVAHIVSLFSAIA